MHTVQNTSANQQQQQFSFHRLDVYRAAVDFAEIADALLHRLPRAKGQLGDQLQRASESIVLRIAESAGCEWRSADQKRYFRAARGSAFECAAILDLCRIRRVGTTEQRERGRELLLRITGMLTRLSRAG